MAPKRRSKVVKTTKVVEETVEVVSIIGSQSQQAQTQTQAQPEVTERREAQSVTKIIPIQEEDAQDKLDDIPIEGRPEIATPPREEAQTQIQAHSKKEGPARKENSGARKRGRGKKGRGGGEGYKRYVYRVMKEVHPGMGITSGAMTVINNFMEDMFERIAGEAYKLSVYSKKQTMGARDIQGAVKLVLPGELGKHAVVEGSKAVNNYVTYGSRV